MSTKLFTVQAFLVLQDGQQVGEFTGFDFRDGFTLSDEGNILALETSSAPVAESLEENEVGLSYAVTGATSDTPVVAGQRKVDLSPFPATLGGLSRVVRFAVDLENAVHSAAYFTAADLRDVTHGGVLVTGTDLDNSGEADRGAGNEFVSAPLTVGSAAGNLRDDVASIYAVRVAGDGITDPMTERAIMTHARLIVSYE